MKPMTVQSQTVIISGRWNWSEPEQEEQDKTLATRWMLASDIYPEQTIAIQALILRLSTRKTKLFQPWELADSNTA